MSGSVKVVSDGPIGGVLRFDLPGIGVAGVGASQPVRDAIFPARRLAEGIRTGMAIRNLGEEAMEVTCRLMSGGTVLEEVEIPLEANGQEARFIAEVFTATDTSDFVGLVRCAAPSLFTGLAIEMDAANRIFTTLPVVPVNLREAEAGRRSWTLPISPMGIRLTSDSGVRECGDPAERSRPHPLSYGHSSDPSRLSTSTIKRVISLQRNRWWRSPAIWRSRRTEV